MPGEPFRAVKVTWRRAGFHRWPEAADVLPERAYLSDRHRHVFHYELAVEVGHNDREVEFHDLLAFAKEVAPADDADLGRRSCEDLAELVGEAVRGRWPGRFVRCSVTEDGEVGALLAWEAGSGG